MSITSSSLSLRLSLAFALAALAGGCGGDGGGAASVASNFLVKDAAIDDLLSFTGVVDSLALVRSSGAETPNLLADPVRVELLSLREDPLWLAHKRAPAGTYTALRMRLQAGSVQALDIRARRSRSTSRATS